MPGVGEGRILRRGPDPRKPLGEGPDRLAVDQRDRARQRLESQPRREDHAGEPVTPAGQIEEARRRLWIHSQGTVPRVEQGKALDGPPERPFARRVLPVDVRRDAAPDRDRGVARLDGQPERPRRGQIEQVAESDPGLDVHEPALGVEAENPVEAGHVEDQAAGAEARCRVRVTAAPGDTRARAAIAPPAPRPARL